MEHLKLSEQPEISELFTVLQEHKLGKELAEVQGLVNYMEDIEEQIGLVMNELKQVNRQLEQISDTSVKGMAEKIAAGVDHEVQQVKGQLQKAKNSIIQFAGKAVAVGKEKGAAGLKKVIKFMKVTPMLGHLKHGFHKAMNQMEKSAVKVEAIHREIHAAGEHQKNIGRAIIGKPMADPDQTDKNKGILVSMSKSYQSMGSVFQRMERWSEKAAASVSAFEKSGSGKKSVKGELKKIKTNQLGKNTQVTHPQKEKAR